MVNLDSFKKNLFSQNGEDGILEEIINRLNKYSDISCCESDLKSYPVSIIKILYL